MSTASKSSQVSAASEWPILQEAISMKAAMVCGLSVLWKSGCFCQKRNLKVTCFRILWLLSGNKAKGKPLDSLLQSLYLQWQNLQGSSWDCLVCPSWAPVERWRCKRKMHNPVGLLHNPLPVAKVMDTQLCIVWGDYTQMKTFIVIHYNY